MGQKTYELSEKDLMDLNINSIEEIDTEIVSKTSFKFLNVIGRGGFGKVWEVLHIKSKKIYAMKEMSKVKILDKKSEISIKNERTLLSKMFHPFIINMHYSFQDTNNLYLIMDYLSGGDLRYQYCLDKDFNEEQTKFLLCCILLSLEYIHSNNILHRDIKPENLVFDRNGYLKLTDFGIAKIYNKNIDNSKENSGTLGYMSPEVLFNCKHDFRCDYYALGIVGYELMIHQRPYEFINRKDAREKILKKEAEIEKKDLRNGWSLNFMDFINKLIKRNPEERLGKNGIEEIKNHPFIKYFNWKDLYLMKIKAPFVPPETGDNYDNQYCNMEEVISEENKIKYNNIMNSMRYRYIFDDYKYYDRKKDNLINNMINKEMNISNNIISLIKNKKGKKPLITRSRNENFYKTTFKKYTMDNLNNMISQYKSMDDEEDKNSENENNEDKIINDIKPCINPHLVYRALELKEIECLSNDEEEKNKEKNIKKYVYKSQSPIDRNKTKKKIIPESRNKNIGAKSYKSIPVNLVLNIDKNEKNKIQENNFINNKSNTKEKIEKMYYNKKKRNINNNRIKVKLLAEKNYINEELEYNLDNIKYNNFVNNKEENHIIRVRKNKNLFPVNIKK